MTKSLFRKIIDREIPSHIIWENDQACAFLDIKPIMPGHTLLVPHTQDPPYIFDMASTQYHALWDRAQWLSGYLKAAFKCKRVGIMVEGFTVPHVHIHLVPINDGSELNPLAAEVMSQEKLLHYQKLISKQIESGTV